METKEFYKTLMTKFGGTNYKRMSIEDMVKTVEDEASKVKTTPVTNGILIKLVAKVKSAKTKEKILTIITETMFAEEGMSV